MRIDLQHVLSNSYADFHAKGFDYLCLFRSPELTLKAYFFEGDVSRAPEVVMPHDHRYGFTTHILSGRSANRLYWSGCEGFSDARAYEVFDYRTILNGGDGFTWRETAWLKPKSETAYGPGERYNSAYDEIHTIQVLAPATVLLLIQGPDTVPLNEPTTAYRLAGSREPPSLSGLYREMDADHALARIGLLAKLAPGLLAEAELVG